LFLQCTIGKSLFAQHLHIVLFLYLILTVCGPFPCLFYLATVVATMLDLNISSPPSDHIFFSHTTFSTCLATNPTRNMLLVSAQSSKIPSQYALSSNNLFRNAPLIDYEFHRQFPTLLPPRYTY